MVFGLLLAVLAGPASAEVLWSWGDQTADENAFLPTADGCWAKTPGDEWSGPTWVSFSYDQAACSGQNWSAGGWLGARFNGASTTTTTTAPATTTTTTAPTTTTTVYNGAGCNVSDPFCRDYVGEQVAVPVSAGGSCLQAGSARCSPEMVNFERWDFSEWAGVKFSVSGPNTYWGVFQSAGGVPQVRHSRQTSGGSTSTGPMCVAMEAGSYRAFFIALAGTGYAYDLPAGTRHLFRPGYRDGVVAAWGSVPVAGGWYSDAEAEGLCAESDPLGSRPQTPSVGCRREFIDVAGVPSVRLTGAVLNPSTRAGVADVVRVRAQFSSEWTLGATATYALPAASTMPAGGWVGVCEVRRTLTGVTGSTAWGTAAPQRVEHPQPAPDGSPLLSGIAPTTVFTAANWAAIQAAQRAVLANMTAGQIAAYEAQIGRSIMTSTGGLIAAGPGGLAAPVAGSSAGTMVGVVVAGAAVGWTWGGVIAAGAERLGVDGGGEWFCRWNPGYRAANYGECDRLLQQNEPAVSRVYDVNGAVIDPDSAAGTAWRSSVTEVQVRIDPTRPDIGGVKSGGLEVPPELDRGRPEYSAQAEEQFTADSGVSPHPATEGDAVFTEPNKNPALEPDGCFNSLWDTLNPLNIAENIGCVLKRLFIPTPGKWQTTSAGMTGLFPLSVMVGISDLSEVVIGGVDGMLSMSPCASFDFSRANRDGTGRLEALKIKLPTPSSVDCPANTAAGTSTEESERWSGDLMGYRVLARNLLRITLYLGFALTVVRTFQPRHNEMEPEASNRVCGQQSR